MPYITQKQINELYKTERYFFENSDWKENRETETALYGLWNVIEELIHAHTELKKKQKEYMKLKRATDPKYDRRKKK